ncbi:hypothetical protein GWO62_10890 [Corynebacterium macginleyi]|uniref:Uncharacterized protein n=2 Tax=Corynebacterium macginleyi TaxID=38290 RepID=A0A3M0GN18_9CORY|nr:hypothetical protein [Corynebacterium macginleyi]MBK4141377.1 hypothetical protein [Corynebacterium macginleyi]MBK4149130.1 hypothetical protein [Corynebacterium macginleyi]MBK4153619.1 hypothetical protein [Corynebacterium macginleyi]MBK4157923.1 hypothetical protein [Corynebacterium macginleyi]MBK4159585.1 hypothetical protein [Corynebacterium macginleyi]
MSPRVLALYGSILAIAVLLFAANIFSTTKNYLVPLIHTVFFTVTNLVLGLWWLNQRVIKKNRLGGLAAVIGILSLLTAASWATWVAAAWSEFQAQTALPIINIAGLPAFLLTPVIAVCCLAAAVRRRQGQRS